MQIQLYLSTEAQEHFGISPQEILTDSEAPLSSDWRALWRCDHLISTEDAKEHLFMLTNSVSDYSMILVDRTKKMDELVHQFQQTLLLALCQHGMPYPDEAFCTEIQLLNELNPQYNHTLCETADAAIDSLCANGIDIDATEKIINIQASQTLRAKLGGAAVEDADILSFPGCAVG